MSIIDYEVYPPPPPPMFFPPLPAWTGITRAVPFEFMNTPETYDDLIGRLRARATLLREEIKNMASKERELQRIEKILELEKK